MIPVTLFGGPLDGLEVELTDELFSTGAIRVPIKYDNSDPDEQVELDGKIAIYVGMDACGVTDSAGVKSILHGRFKFDSVG